MTRTSLHLLAALTVSVAVSAVAQEPPTPGVQPPAEAPQLFTVEELDNLLAPVALYPDPILAQVLVAATFPDQIALAARYVRTYGLQGIDDQAWDVSVKAVARYAPVLNLLDERPDWTTALGQAYALQAGDVMASVQGLRKMAQAQGNLESTSQQRIVREDDAIRIIPASPQVIYVPTYDPAIVYYEPVRYVRSYSPYWSFGVAFPIGVWLNYDCDWGNRVVYYHGWDGYGHRRTWYHDSRPFISINTIYVNSWHTVVILNRRVVGRYVNYGGFDRYNWVHRRVTWDRRGLPGRYDGDRWNAPDGRRGGGFNTPRREVTNNRPRPTAPHAEPRTTRPRDETNRVTPVRVGSTNRPYYPRPGADEQPAPSRNNGTWNARPTAPVARRETPERASTASPAPRANPRAPERQVTRAPQTYTPRAPQTYSPRAPQASSPRASAPRQAAPSRPVTVSRAPRQSSPSAPSARPAPRGERSAPARSEPRAAKRKN